MATSKKAPWKRPNPKAGKKPSTHLTPSQKAAAKRRAKKARRPYPNLVDNMQVAAKSKEKRAKKKRP